MYSACTSQLTMTGLILACSKVAANSIVDVGTVKFAVSSKILLLYTVQLSCI